MPMRLFRSLSIALATVAFAITAFAQDGLPWADGEVRWVSPRNKKVTLRHGEIPNLQMGPMTMDFRVRDEALLDRLRPGDRIRFTAVRQGGVFVILSVEPAPASR